MWQAPSDWKARGCSPLPRLGNDWGLWKFTELTTSFSGVHREMVIYGDLMDINGDLMGFYGGLMGFNGILWWFNGM